MMNRLKFQAACLVLLFAVAVPSGAQQANTSTLSQARFMINFPVGKTALNWTFGDNRYALAELNRFFSNADRAAIDSIRITGSTSPEGGEQINMAYAKLRAQAMRDCLVEAYDCNSDQIAVRSQWNTWAEMIKLVNADPTIPKKSEVMILLNAWHVPYDQRLKLMNDLDYSDSYRQIKEKVFPVLRNVHAVVIFYRVKPNEKPFVVHDIKSEYERLPTAIAQKYDVLQAVVLPPDAQQIAPESAQEAAPVDTIKTVVVPEPVLEEQPRIEPGKRQKPLFALKTNLLYDAATIVNLSLEVPIGKHFSVAVEAIFPWWINEQKQTCLQIHNLNLEGKYWFSPRESQKLGKFPTMTGWFVGVYGGAARYDIEYQGKGYQGDVVLSAGLMGGYAHSIGKSLRMEYSLGVGYMQTDYRRYEAQWSDRDNRWDLLRQQTDKYTWIGPTHAKISLVWMLNRNVKKGGQ